MLASAARVRARSSLNHSQSIFLWRIVIKLIHSDFALCLYELMMGT